MTIEPREPPPQFIFRLKRAVGGRAGWNGFAVQIVFVAVLVWIGYEIVANVRANLAAVETAALYLHHGEVVAAEDDEIGPRD